MAYKIKNVTNLLDRRHPFLNTSVDIDYVNKSILNETVRLNVGEELIFDSEHLPTSIHNLRIKKFIRVIQITEHDLAGILTPKQEESPVVVEESEKTNKSTKKK